MALKEKAPTPAVWPGPPRISSDPPTYDLSDVVTLRRPGMPFREMVERDRWRREMFARPLAPAAVWPLRPLRPSRTDRFKGIDWDENLGPAAFMAGALMPIGKGRHR